MKNDYEIRGNVVVIFLESKKHGRKETLIDLDDLPKVKKHPYKWSLRYKADIDSFYAQSLVYKGNKRTTIQLHRYILDAPKSFEVDHITHDTLDNRKENLRIASRSENNQNRKGASRNNKCGVRGCVLGRERESLGRKSSIKQKMCLEKEI